MSWLEENIGEGYQQVVVGFTVFIIGSIAFFAHNILLDQ